MTNQAPINHAAERPTAKDYLVARSSDRRAKSAWWAHCRDHRLPFIWVQPKRVNASVTYDVTPTGRKVTRKQVESIADLIRPFRCFAAWGEDFGTIGPLPVEEAKAVAEGLYEVLK